MREILFRGNRKDNGEWIEDGFENCGNFISAADVVEVVRCSECKYFGKELKQSKHSCLNYQLPYCLENDYCSYGERKDGDKK